MTGGWLECRDRVETYVAEDDALADARARAARLGCRTVGQGVGAALRFLATVVSARAVVEIGTGTGVSGLWLLQGMVPDGTLTSIDIDPEAQRAARAVFIGAGNGPSRLRLINGMALEVLPRLTDGGYDLVFVDAGAGERVRYLEESVRLLRPGGVVAINGVLAGPPPAASDPGLPDVAVSMLEDERLAPVLLPLGEGLLAAVKRPE